MEKGINNRLNIKRRVFFYTAHLPERRNGVERRKVDVLFKDELIGKVIDRRYIRKNGTRSEEALVPNNNVVQP
jgi:hypothetical protein